MSGSGAGEATPEVTPSTPSSSWSTSAAASATAVAASPPSGGGKRTRDSEEEVYLDNFHSSKRYLSEIMASSLNGLSVGDTLAADNLMESPARSESIGYPRDEMVWQYSPMSEDSDDSRYCEASLSTTIVQSDMVSSPTSPVSPHRPQSPFMGFSAAGQYPLPNCALASVICCHQRQRGADSEGRFPSSPNDMCHTTDLRRAALLRSVQMRTQPRYPPAYELLFNSGPDNMQSTEEGEDRPSSCVKSLDVETVYQGPDDNEADYIEDCTSVEDLSDSKVDRNNVEPSSIKESCSLDAITKIP